MMEQPPPTFPSTELPQATVSPQKGLSLIWVVPIVALLIGAGLIYTTFTEKGPTVTITFASAEGLEAGKTKVRFKDVEIGQVQSVELTHDMKGVRVTVDLAKETKDYLTEHARFWVVRPRLSGSTVSGLGTLLSGVYIAVEPGRQGKAQFDFTGLEIPPMVTGDLRGKVFTLKADKLDSLDYGSPVHYRGVKVGQVTGYALQKEGKGVDVMVFIDAPHDRIVTESSRFWSASGLDMDVSTDGLRINTQSLMSLLIGGIVLANPGHLDTRPLAGGGAVFPLYPSRDAAMAEQFTEKEYYRLNFSQSVRGLEIGAPVEFKGFPVGRVVDIGIEFDWEHKNVLVPVGIEVAQERLLRIASGAPLPEKTSVLDILVEQGMRGQVKTASLITGKLYVALDFFPSAEPARMTANNGISEIPTIATPIEEIAGNLSAVLASIQKIPMEKIGVGILDTLQSVQATSDGIGALAASREVHNTMKNLDATLLHIQKLANGLETQLPPTVKQARQTMEGLNALVARDSSTVVEFQRALGDLGEAARAIRLLAEYLERHPESLLKGKGGE
ncbi:MAG: MCE family protein [Desulfobacterium sp.]|nr:MCE family protein [Desulfobacterium sp.]